MDVGQAAGRKAADHAATSSHRHRCVDAARGDGPRGDGPWGDGPWGDGPWGDGPWGDGPWGDGRWSGLVRGLTACGLPPVHGDRTGAPRGAMGGVAGVPR